MRLSNQKEYYNRIMINILPKINFEQNYFSNYWSKIIYPYGNS